MAPKPAPEGKFFTLKGAECDIYLTIQDESSQPGTPVVIAEKDDKLTDSQMWYEDQITRTIRSKNDHLCLSVNDDGIMIVDNLQVDNDNQKWIYDSGSRVVKNTVDDRVLDVIDHNTIPGSPVGAMEATGEENQAWAYHKQPNLYFMLLSEFSGLALEAEAKMVGGVKAGAKVVTGGVDRKENQLWYEDENGILRSKVKGMGLTCAQEQAANVCVDVYDESDPMMQWVILPNRCIASRSMLTNVVDIKARKKTKGAETIVWQDTGANNQKWIMEYITKKSKKSGDSDSEDD